MEMSEYDETRATARLPNLDIEILHRRPWEGNEEQLVVMLRAVPSFEAVGRWLEASNPLLVWSRMMQAAWSPWVHGLTGEAHVEDCASIYGSWAGLSRRGGQGDAVRELSSSLRDAPD